jgi:hypothetical protein
MKLNKRIAGAMVGVGLLVGILGSGGVVLAHQSTSADPGKAAAEFANFTSTVVVEDVEAGDRDNVQVEDGSEADDVLETADKVEDDLEAGDKDNVQEEDVSEADDAFENSGAKVED